MTVSNDPLASGGDVLSQNEVERLLSQVQELETTTTVFSHVGGRTQHKAEDIQPFDFRQPAFLAPSEMRKIRLRYEDFIRALAANLSIYLRVEFGLRMSKLQTISYQKLAESLPNPTHLTLFKAEPLKGICLLDLPPKLGLTIVDRLLGGPGHSVNGDRDLSDIESALLDEVIMLILNDWCNQWQKLQELRPAMLGHETTPRFLHTSAHDTVMLVLSMEATLGDCIEQVQMAFPYFTIEPLVRQLASLTAPEKEAGTGARASGKPRWSSDFNDIPVGVNAEWQGLELTVRALSMLKPGDVLMLEPECFDQVRVSYARTPKFHGRLGTRSQKWAVELTAAIPS
jgi:flagellar motor switch protein FliM